MAFVAITVAESDFKSPMDEDLWGKVRDNFDDHETRILVLEAKPSEPDNTVVESEVDSSGRPNYISAGAGLSVDVDGTITKWVANIGGKVQEITTVENVGSLPPNTINFIKATKGAGTLPTLGFLDVVTTNIPPSVAFVPPTAPTNGDYWFDLASNQMNKRVGGAWVAEDTIFIGVAITDGASVTDVLTFENRLTPHDRFRLFGDSTDALLNVTSGTTTIDDVNQHTFVQVTASATLNHTGNSQNLMVLQSQWGAIIRGTYNVDVLGLSASSEGGGLGGGGGGGGGAGTLDAGAAAGGRSKTSVNTVIPGAAGGAIGGAGTAGAAANFEPTQWDGMRGYYGNAGGTGGQGSGSSGGVPGAGGGAVMLFAPAIFLTSTGVMTADGGNGVGGIGGNAGGGGGGGGGYILTVSRSFVNSGTRTVTGGTGAGGNPPGAIGGVGGAGKIVDIQV